jgi:hypothetical protein
MSGLRHSSPPPSACYRTALHRTSPPDERYHLAGRQLRCVPPPQVPEGGSTFQPNPNSIVQSDRGVNHLDYFK